LFARVVRLQKAAEVMGMEVDGFLKTLDLLGLEFSYLTDEDVAIEQSSRQQNRTSYLRRGDRLLTQLIHVLVKSGNVADETDAGKFHAIALAKDFRHPAIIGFTLKPLD
jgi:hypothetical protein